MFMDKMLLSIAPVDMLDTKNTMNYCIVTLPCFFPNCWVWDLRGSLARSFRLACNKQAFSFANVYGSCLSKVSFAQVPSVSEHSWWIMSLPSVYSITVCDVPMLISGMLGQQQALWFAQVANFGQDHLPFRTLLWTVEGIFGIIFQKMGERQTRI